MSDKRPCIHCNRSIDRYAKSCVYCSWDQSQEPGSIAIPVVGAGPAYVPPVDHRFRNRILGLLAFIALVIGAFVIGAHMHGADAKEAKVAKAEPVTSSKAEGEPAPARNDIQIVPASAAAIAEAPITSAPASFTADGVPPEYQRNDATAATSEEYARLAARAKEERRVSAVIDPRTLPSTQPGRDQNPGNSPQSQARRSAGQERVPQGSVSAERGPRAAGEGVPIPMNPGETARSRIPSRTASRRASRTAPVPISQPIPAIHVSRNTTARLDLTVGADGTVRDVNILEPIPGETAKLIAAIQSWRFKPATENGVPIAAHFSVDISFHPNE